MQPRAIRAGLVLLLWAAPGAALQRPAGEGAHADALAVAVSAGFEHVRSPADIARESRLLAQLGAEAIPLLFERLGPARDASGTSMTTQATALAALAQLPREGLLAFLTQLARSTPDDERRCRALELLGRLGGRDELRLALQLGEPADPAFPPGTELRSALETALLGICERERGALRTCASFFPRTLPALRAVVAHTVSRAGGEEAAGLLAGQLGSVGVEADALLLLEIGACASRSHGSQDQLVLERVRGLLGHPDSRLATLACGALEKLRDHEAVPDLIVLLGDDDPNLRARAHVALTSLTGLVLPAEAQPWIAWLDPALAWWDERAEDCRVALVSGSAAEAAAAVRESAGQRLFLGRVAELLALALRRRETDVVESACRALGAIPERAAREALVGALAHPEASVVARAQAALARHERLEAHRPGPLRLPARNRIP